MQFFARRKIPVLLGLCLGAACLAISLAFLAQRWTPKIRSQAWLAPKMSDPVAGDFPLFWTASHLALAGNPAAVYDPQKFGPVEQELTGTGPHPFPYPPTGLLMILPLAALPYLPSLSFWLAATLTGYLVVLRRIAANWLVLLWGVAFFGAFQNFYFGQNGFLTATLMGGGLLLLEGSPFLGGLVLGLLCYKPQMLLLVPVALVAGRRWRGLGGVLTSAAAMISASLLLFGSETWLTFWRSIPVTMHHLASTSTWFYKMPTLYCAARLAGLGPQGAWVLHGLGMAVVVAAVTFVWRREASMALRAATLILGVLLFTPHLWYYDLPLLAVALAWIFKEGQETGWLVGEQLLWLGAWLLPLLSFSLELDFRWPLGPAYLLAPIILVMRRFRVEEQVDLAHPVKYGAKFYRLSQ